MMTLQEFSTSSPAPTEIKFFVDGDKVIKGMNVSSTACNGVNTFDALGALTTLSVDIEGTNYTFNILTRELKNGYYFYTVEDVYVSGLADNVSDSNNFDCNFSTLVPSSNDATFDTSEYNATFANAVNTRLNSFIYDVDRIKNQTIPTNYDSILSGSADFAPVPDSNYTSVGFSRGRFIGSKTTSEDFGIDPAFIATLFDGSVYTINKDDISICSQSVAERPIKEYLFSPNLRYTPSQYLSTLSGQSVDALETPSIRKGFVQKGDSGLEFNSNSTILELNGNPDIRIGDHLLIVSSSLANEGIDGKYEYLHVTGKSYNEDTNILSVNIDHQVFSKYGNTSSVNITAIRSYAIYNLFGDSIYVPNGGQVYRVADKKLYVPEIDSIFITDERGQIVYLSSTCTN